MKRKNPHIGSSFEDFLDEEDILEECTNTAIKRVIPRQVEQAMKQQGLSKAAMARQMGTSRFALDRLLDPDDASITLETLQRAASVEAPARSRGCEGLKREYYWSDDTNGDVC